MKRQSKILNRDGELIGYEMDIPIRKKAEKAVLTALLDLSREKLNLGEKGSTTYFSTMGIAENTPPSPNHYGIINNVDVPVLFRNYVERGIVSGVIITRGPKGKKLSRARGYLVNPERFKELEKILKEL